MKKWLVMVTLAAVLLAMTGSALAEEASYTPVNADELLGVWQSEDDDALVLYMLPGTYAPVNDLSRMPELYAKGKWQETRERQLDYLMLLNKRREQRNSFLDSLLGASMSRALQTLKSFNDDTSSDEPFDCFDYSNARIGVTWFFEEGEEEYEDYTTVDEGTIFAFRDEDGEVSLFWMDDYDPHIPGIMMRRLSAEAPSAEALTEGVLRPVIDMAGDAALQTAVAVARWAAEKQCMRMDSAALVANLRAAYDALSPEDAQAFKDNYGKFDQALIDALRLNPKTWNDPDPDKLFEDAGLQDAIATLANDTESQRSVEVLNSAVEGIIG